MTRSGFGILAAMLLSAAALGQQSQQAQDSTTRREEAYRHNNIGVARLEQYDYPGAATDFERALELHPDLAIARLNLAIARLYEGQLEPAAQHGRAALEKLPAMPQANYVLGLVARADNRPDEAAGFFERVVQTDPADAGSRVQLGQVRLAQRRFPDAATLFEAALRLEPFNATAAYGLATALTRSGERERGAAAMQRFQTLRDNPAAVTFETTYLSQGRYGEAVASTGLEAELVDRAVPAVTFADATASVLPAGDRSGRLAALVDIDRDHDLDLIVARDRDLQLLRNADGRFSAAKVLPVPGATAAVAGDYDNDGARDLAVVTERSLLLFKQEGEWSFRDVTAATLPAVRGPIRTAAFVDADHDGDLDLLAGGQLLRNNGAGRLEDTTQQAQLALGTPIAVVPTDFDNRRDVDLLVLRADSVPALLSNQRDGTFREVAGDAALPADAPAIAVAVADINKDMASDFFFARRDGPGVFALSGPSGRFTRANAPEGTAGTQAAQLFDYDNDGLVDLLALTSNGLKLWRSVGTEWTDVTAKAFPSSLTAAAQGVLAIGDIDGDGDQDLVIGSTEGVRVLRNDGGNKRPSIGIRLAARVSNRDATGSKVELRAGSLRQRVETFATTPAVAPADIVFGLGPRQQADVVRVLWPAGILQAETTVTRPATLVEELDRKPSSCPFLYTWNGTRFEFITDFLGGGELGYWVAPGMRGEADSDEYVRIPGEQLHPRDGKYELRITNELEEALFVDRLQLVAVAHPKDVEVHPNEGLRSRARREPFTLYTAGGSRPPVSVSDQDGRDVRDRITHRDRHYVDGFTPASIRGYADEHWVEFDIGPTAATGRDERVLLLFTGWTDYAFSSDNVAAHQAGLAFRPPELQARDPHGKWHAVMPEIGLPVGRPQTVVIDVTPQARAGVRTFRAVTTLRVYWDQILVATSGKSPVDVTRLEPHSAVLEWRGFSAETRPDGREPAAYDYQRVGPYAPWKLMTGRYTREGDVTPLVGAIDDRFVIAAPGDEIAVSFDATLPPLPSGWVRTFLLFADGFSKEMNLHSASPDAVEPLPFHGMSAYPYAPPERYPDTEEHRRYREEYNTRIIGRMFPPLETTK